MKNFASSFLFLSLSLSVCFTDACLAATTHRVSLANDATQADGDSYNAVVSGNGQFVVFESDATNLVSGDSNGVMDIFVRDRLRGTTSRVSVSGTGEQSDGLSANAAISHDGRFVVFESNAGNLVADDTNNTTDIFLHDRLTGVTERISDTSEFGEANMDSHSPVISADGRYIAYYSFADNLVAGDSNGAYDVFVYDRIQALTVRVSVSGAGAQANGDSYFPQISADGGYVSFASFADNLVAGDTNGRYDVFVYDLLNRTTEIVSVNTAGVLADNHSFFSSLSGDGRYVAFESSAANLSPGDFNRRTDIFLRDRLNQTTQRISLFSDGRSPFGASTSPRINSAGTLVGFASAVDLLIGVDTNTREDVYLYDIAANSLELVSVDSDDNNADYGSDNPSLSADGLFVAFQSMATNLVVDDTNAREDIFIRNRAPNQPPVADAGQDQNVYLGTTVQLSGSASYDPDGDSITQYTWSLELAPAGSNAGLSTTDTVDTQLLPDVVGDYVVSLVVSDDQSSSIADEVFIRVIENLPPLAVISATPLSGFAPLTVQFDASASSDPENGGLSYHWDLGTGLDESDLVAPSFIYSLPGTYHVVLTVQDDFGNQAEAGVDIIVSAANEPPTLAPYTTTPTQGPAPLRVAFVANASDPDGDMLSYFWDFGDGITSSEPNPEHVFYDPGAYTVYVEVSDGEFTVNAQLFVAVDSGLDIKEIEAELDWDKRQHGSKLKLEIELNSLDNLRTDDAIRVAFGELLLLDTTFAQFEPQGPGVFVYKHRRVYAKLDMNKNTLKISKRLYSGAVPVGQPVPIMVTKGGAMATEQVVLDEESKPDYTQKEHRKHAKFCKRKLQKEFLK